MKTALEVMRLAAFTAGAYNLVLALRFRDDHARCAKHLGLWMLWHTMGHHQ